MITRNINARAESLQATRRAAAEELAQGMQEYAQENAKWKDQTGDARKGLQGKAIHADSTQVSTAFLGHGVDYGYYLETMDQGEYQIIMPTLLYFNSIALYKIIELDSFESIASGIYGLGGSE